MGKGFTQLLNIESKVLMPTICIQELWDQIKRESSEDSKLQGTVEGLERMLNDSDNRYQVSVENSVLINLEILRSAVNL